MAELFKPFADGETAPSVSTLTIENGTARISISGFLDIARDQESLGHVRTLYSLLAAIVAALEAECDLPERAATPSMTPTRRKPNPFT